MPRRDEYLPVRAALEVTIASDPQLSSPQHAALIALCRVTADQVDASGAEVSSRLIASYLSALKDLHRVMSDKSGSKGDPVGKLKQLQALKGGRSA